MTKYVEVDTIWPIFDHLSKYDHFDVSNMPKSYLDQRLRHETQFTVFCNFVKEDTENSCLINGHFRTISSYFFANYMNQKLGSEDHFDVSNMPKS